MARLSSSPSHDDADSAQRLTVAQLYRGRARLALIRDLALGEWSYRELAENCGQGITASDIAQFASEYSREITEVRASLASKVAEDTAGLWITQRRLRIAEIQSDFEDTQDEMIRLKQEPAANLGVGSRKHYQLNRIRLALLRAVADELSPARTGPRGKDDDQDDSNIIHYVIEGGDGVLGSMT